MTDAVFEAAVSVVLYHEGGYVSDHADRGGETNFGISARSYPDLDIKGLTVEKAKAIYFTDWWIRYRINQLPGALLPAKVLDTAVLAGPLTAMRLLQHALNAVGRPCAVDGAIGPATVQACRSASGDALLTAYRRLIEEHYEKIAEADPSQDRFLNGWRNRALA